MAVVHVIAVVAGAVMVLAVTGHILRTLVVPRARRTLLSTLVDSAVDHLFQVLLRPFPTYEAKDRVLAGQGAAVLVAQLLTWLAGYEVAYSLVLWPQVHGMGAALEQVASSMFTLGVVYTPGAASTAVDVLAAGTGVVVVALQIAYLPTLYSAFNRRETEVTLLGARAGTPAWGPELLLRARYGVAVKSETFPALYERWERWAADVAESHSNYPVLVRFRSPRALTSWLVSLLAVMDSAAMMLALCPSRERIEPRLALRSGFSALRDIGAALGYRVDDDPDPDRGISLTFEEFAEAVAQLDAVEFPREREVAEAWPHFRGWRVNYEDLAYALALRTDAVPAPWSGPRRWKSEVIPVRRPPNRRPGSSPATTANLSGVTGSLPVTGDGPSHAVLPVAEGYPPGKIEGPGAGTAAR